MWRDSIESGMPLVCATAANGLFDQALVLLMLGSFHAAPAPGYADPRAHHCVPGRGQCGSGRQQAGLCLDAQLVWGTEWLGSHNVQHLRTAQVQFWMSRVDMQQRGRRPAGAVPQPVQHRPHRLSQRLLVC
jgi:hypothetical protein